jgi:DNA/RNA-binding domain of Phe-tRNA-synthetase-like protein
MINPFFRYDSEILEIFPALSGGALHGNNLNNRDYPYLLQELFHKEQQGVLELIGNIHLSEIDSLAGWRTAFRMFGVDPTQYRSAAEALLRRLTKKGEIPSINAIVDCCNLVSIRYALPVAAFDLAKINAPITVRLASGSEIFISLYETELEHPESGEVVFTDNTGVVVARRWCWRQSNESVVGEETRDALFTIEAHHSNGKVNVDQAIVDLKSLLYEYCGGEFEIVL